MVIGTVIMQIHTAVEAYMDKYGIDPRYILIPYDLLYLKVQEFKGTPVIYANVVEVEVH